MAVKNAQLKSTPVEILDPDGDVAGPYTGGVPGGLSYAITNLMICNTSLTAPASFDLHIVPYGKPLDNSVTIVVRNLELPPTETFTFDSEKIVLDEGDKVVLTAEPGSGDGTTTLAATISYLEV